MTYTPDAYDTIANNITVDADGIPDADQEPAIALAVARGFTWLEARSALDAVRADVADWLARR